MSNPRTVCWFSCGAASAVAAKLTLKTTPDAVIACVVIPGEHEDNQRFLTDCEDWFGRPVIRLASKRYRDHWDVIEKRRFIVGPKGALCTTELKKMVRHEFQQADDIQVFGYTAEEVDRAARFRAQNFEVRLETPLIERGLTKADCLGMIERAGIQLPAMYRLGYQNNNCIGCVKGGMGYWNKIRVDFPEVFERMALAERSLSLKTGKKRTVLKDGRKRVFLDELEPGRGDYKSEADIECSLMCHSAALEIAAGWGEKKRTQWLSCALFGDRAEKIAPYLTKGTLVEVHGTPQAEGWEKNGTVNAAIKVSVSEVKLHGGGKRDEPVADRGRATRRDDLDDGWDIPF